MDKHYVFGTAAVEAVDAADGQATPDLAEVVKSEGFGTFHWTALSTPDQLLEAVDGWNLYAEIDEELYNMLQED